MLLQMDSVWAHPHRSHLVLGTGANWQTAWHDGGSNDQAPATAGRLHWGGHYPLCQCFQWLQPNGYWI